MPCYSINTMSVDINATNRDLLESAIKSLGLRYDRSGNDFHVAVPALGNIVISGAQAVINPDAQNTLNSIKVAYSKESIKKVAKAKGWTGSWKIKQNYKQVIRLKKY